MSARALTAVALVLALAARGRAAAPAPAAGAAPVKAEAAKAAPVGAGVETVYTGDKSRDPFMRAAVGGVAKIVSETTEETPEFSIHVLALRAVMQDKGAGYAIVADNGTGIKYILRNGRLYDPKSKPMEGVSGKVDVKARSVSLKTADGDVQVLKLGEEDRETNP